MPIKNKHSDLAGHRANLTPGEVGHNRQDDLLLIRGDERKLEIPLADWRDHLKSVPLDGIVGSPLTHLNGVLVWNPDLLAVGQMGGGYYVDASPGLDGWGVPGFIQDMADFRAGAPVDQQRTRFAANDVSIEDFYIASESIDLTFMGLRLFQVGASLPKVRIGIVDAATGVPIVERLLNPPSTSNSLPIGGVTLPRGWYHLMVWAGGDVDVARFSGTRYNLSFDVDVNGAFVGQQRSYAQADMSAGLFVDNGLAITPVTSHTVGEDKHGLLRWLLPIPGFTPNPIIGIQATPATLSAAIQDGGTATTPETSVQVFGGSGLFDFGWTTPAFSAVDPASPTTAMQKSLAATDSFNGSATILAIDKVTGQTISTTVPVHMSSVSTAPPPPPPPPPTPLGLSFSPASFTQHVLAGSAVSVSGSATPSGGSGDYDLTWDGSPDASGTAGPNNGDTVTLSLGVTLTDLQTGQQISRSGSYTFISDTVIISPPPPPPPPPPPLSVTITPNPNVSHVAGGGTAHFTFGVSISGGSGLYSIHWDDGSTGGSRDVSTHAFANDETDGSVSVSVTDLITGETSGDSAEWVALGF
jgi:hypothetical protein